MGKKFYFFLDKVVWVVYTFDISGGQWSKVVF